MSENVTVRGKTSGMTHTSESVLLDLYLSFPVPLSTLLYMGIWEPDWLAEGGKKSDWARVITTYNEMKTL